MSNMSDRRDRSDRSEDREVIDLDSIQALLVDHGYEVTLEKESLRIRDLENGIVIRAVLEDNILFNTVNLISLEDDRITLEIARKMLDAENRITTSSFQLYKGSKTTVALSNFCKLQSLGLEDEDDILSCLQFLEIDALFARDLLAAIID